MTTTLRCTLPLLALLSFTLPSLAIDEVIDSAVPADPKIPSARVVKVFPATLLPLWLRALDRPESDLKCQAAATIALAHQRGMAGLEAAIPALLRVLDQPQQQPTVRLAVAQTLIALDARLAAKSFFDHAHSDGIEFRNLVEPALARWGYEPMRAVWLERISQSEKPGRGWILAIQGLATLGESKTIPRLREFAFSASANSIIRVEAAKALGSLQTTGLEKEAEQAAEKGGPDRVGHLVAASVLRKHRGDAAAKIQERLAVEADATAAAVALDGLLDYEPRRVLPLLTRIAASPDAVVRSKALEAFRRTPSSEHISLAADLLDDPHPQVRVAARKALLEAARRTELGEQVRRQAMRQLGTAHWRALEQAAIVLTLLDYKPAAPRFVELLQFERPEVFLATAWGLRRLAVPETLPGQLQEIDRRWKQSLNPNATFAKEIVDHEVSQLAQSLGKARYMAASPVLSRFIPKQGNIGMISRASAIWALGLIHERKPPNRLVQDLIGRLTDESVMMPEDLGVRSQSAVALGRMKVEEARDSFTRYYHKKLTTEILPNACGWALEQLTGEKLPTTGTAEVVQRGWFLEGNQ